MSKKSDREGKKSNLQSAEPIIADWGQQPKLTAEQTIIWLDLHRRFMWEVWASNPELRKKWEEKNL